MAVTAYSGCDLFQIFNDSDNNLCSGLVLTYLFSKTALLLRL